MGPSSRRLGRVEGASSRVPRPGSSNTEGQDVAAVPAPPVDPKSLATRYRRGKASEAAAKGAGDVEVGPALGRKSRPAATDTQDRPGKELASPRPNAGTRVPRPGRGAEANESRDPNEPTAGAPGSGAPPRPYANPKRARAAAQSTPVGAATGAAIQIGLNYGLGWPACSNVNWGCWDDGWYAWVNWCSGYGGYYPWRWHYWGWWGYGSSYWLWNACWYPFAYYRTYYPSVVIYDDPDPQVVYVSEAPPVEVSPQVGEGVIDVPADAGTRPVDSDLDSLLKGNASASARAATQNLAQGDTAFREGRYGDAVHFYAKAIEFQPDQAVLYLVLSDALFATGDYHYGAYALRKALELDPTLVDTLTDKHEFYADPAEFDRQLAVLENYLRDRPTDQDARLLLAANYLFGTRPAAAVDLLEAPESESLRATVAGARILDSARVWQHQAAAARAK